MTFLHDERPIRTNPVWWWRKTGSESSLPRAQGIIDALLSEGVRLPAGFCHQLTRRGVAVGDRAAPSTPGVVGLIVALPRREEGFVVPLRVALSPQWHIDPTLPFSAETVQDDLTSLLSAAHVGLAQVYPHARGLTFVDDTGIRSGGDSMRIAAVLAALSGAFSSTPAAQRRCCRRSAHCSRIAFGRGRCRRQTRCVCTRVQNEDRCLSAPMIAKPQPVTTPALMSFGRWPTGLIWGVPPMRLASSSVFATSQLITSCMIPPHSATTHDQSRAPSSRSADRHR